MLLILMYTKYQYRTNIDDSSGGYKSGCKYASAFRRIWDESDVGTSGQWDICFNNVHHGEFSVITNS